MDARCFAGTTTCGLQGMCVTNVHATGQAVYTNVFRSVVSLQRHADDLVAEQPLIHYAVAASGWMDGSTASTSVVCVPNHVHCLLPVTHH